LPRLGTVVAAAYQTEVALIADETPWVSPSQGLEIQAFASHFASSLASHFSVAPC